MILSRNALHPILGQRLPAGGMPQPAPGSSAAADWLSRQIAETRRRLNEAWAAAENASIRYQEALATVSGIAPGLPEGYIGADPRLLRAYNAMWDREAEYRREAARLRNLQRQVPRRPSGPRVRRWR